MSETPRMERIQIEKMLNNSMEQKTLNALLRIEMILSELLDRRPPRDVVSPADIEAPPADDKPRKTRRK